MDVDKLVLLEELGFSSIQVTIDGNEEVHDSRRVLRDGRGTYKRITANLDRYLISHRPMRIHINLVVDESNAESAVREKMELEEKWRGKNVSFYLSEITSTKHDEYSLASSDTYINNNPAEGVSVCTSHGDHNFIIDFKGDIYKCITGAGDPDFCIGNIKDDLQSIRVGQAKYIEPRSNNKNCSSCGFLPVCKLGCQYYTIKNPLAEICNKDKLKEYYLHLVARKNGIKVTELEIVDDDETREIIVAKTIGEWQEI
ncbi:MAG: SPASM domain-containing protein [Spirochaetales bacterium]|nr:SPASM domain-containing protein [Spirochaetales bacterium]